VNDYVHAQGLLGDVYFDYDRSELRPEARTRLEANARFLKEHPQFVVTIEGHCDERGTIEYNIALGDRRASAAKRFLEESGVAAGTLRAVSYGKERPVCFESREDCWSKNRRAAFVITGRK
jgi:peptidoglycan-associated lipoprotein